MLVSLWSNRRFREILKNEIWAELSIIEVTILSLNLMLVSLWSNLRFREILKDEIWAEFSMEQHILNTNAGKQLS